MEADKALMQEAAWAARAMQGSKDPQAPEGRARSLTFRPLLGHHAYQCPRCWVRQGVRATLRAVASDTDDYDLLRCGVCEGDFIIPI